MSVVVTNRLYRIVDFQTQQRRYPAVVERLEYDLEPFRGEHALVLVQRRRTPLHPSPRKRLKAGDQIQFGVDAAIKAGNTPSMRNIPVGSTVHNVENETV